MTDVAADEVPVEDLLGEVSRLSGEMEKGKMALAQQTEVFRLLRNRGVTWQKIADAAGVSEEAVIQRLRPRATKKKTVAKRAR